MHWQPPLMKPWDLPQHVKAAWDRMRRLCSQGSLGYETGKHAVHEQNCVILAERLCTGTHHQYKTDWTGLTLHTVTATKGYVQASNRGMTVEGCSQARNGIICAVNAFWAT